MCKPGFAGADCSIDICSLSRCGGHGTCASQYLGDSSTLPVANKACVCDDGWYGHLCDKQYTTNVARQGPLRSQVYAGAEYQVERSMETLPRIGAQTPSLTLAMMNHPGGW